MAIIIQDIFGNDMLTVSCFDLVRANLSRAQLTNADLRDMDLSCANLSEANLYNANLSGANLSGANLSRAILDRAILTGANLDEANLSEARLGSSELFKANLDMAILARADFTGANFLETSMKGAILNEARITPEQLVKAKMTTHEQILHVIAERALPVESVIEASVIELDAPSDLDQEVTKETIIAELEKPRPDEIRSGRAWARHVSEKLKANENRVYKIFNELKRAKKGTT